MYFYMNVHFLNWVNFEIKYHHKTYLAKMWTYP